MKTFIRKLLLFSSLPVLSLILIYSTLVAINPEPVIKVSPDITTVFIGDSHIQTSIYDSLISHGINLGMRSESFYLSYFKLQNLLNNNSSITKVYLGVGYHSISSSYDAFLCGTYSALYTPNYFYLLPFEEKIRVLYWSKSKIAIFTMRMIKNEIKKRIGGYQNQFLGGFENEFTSTSANYNSIDKRIKFQYYNNDSLNSFADKNIKYLKNIDSLCYFRNIKLTLVNTPLHLYYKEKVPPKFKTELLEINSLLHAEYLDITDIRLHDDCYIPDGDHLSKTGAIKTSIELASQNLN